MTPAELLTFINDEITTNGNNEITADVLRPVLTAMVNQINDLVGDEGDLPSGSDDVISAINNVSNGVIVHEGLDNPNDTPPVTFGLGDFYAQLNISDVILSFWQYNGIQWTEILSRYEQKLRNVSYTDDDYTLEIEEDILIYSGFVPSAEITMPNLVDATGKTFYLVNLSDGDCTVSDYKNLSFDTTDVFSQNSILKLYSNGIYWLQLNN